MNSLTESPALNQRAHDLAALLRQAEVDPVAAADIAIAHVKNHGTLGTDASSQFASTAFVSEGYRRGYVRTTAVGWIRTTPLPPSRARDGTLATGWAKPQPTAELVGFLQQHGIHPATALDLVNEYTRAHPQTWVRAHPGTTAAPATSRRVLNIPALIGGLILGALALLAHLLGGSIVAVSTIGPLLVIASLFLIVCAWNLAVLAVIAIIMLPVRLAQRLFPRS